jgi:hypothetical protein
MAWSSTTGEVRVSAWRTLGGPPVSHIVARYGYGDVPGGQPDQVSPNTTVLLQDDALVMVEV